MMRLDPFQKTTAEVKGDVDSAEFFDDFDKWQITLPVGRFHHEIEVTYRLMVMNAEDKIYGFQMYAIEMALF
ncbi:MAG: hypothetical protein BWX60_01085 [Candidatus Marinimicrobia bacterium ADurb.Bin030]|nr:MAG: hypothetical protein BWX60_01085 [Candidatus Marinimicrobia bacterium ADurb.Bin030]